MATPTVVKKILRFKQENPGMFAWEIREQLLSQRICEPHSIPSVSSVNRILRNSGMWPSTSLEQPVATPPASYLQEYSHSMWSTNFTQPSRFLRYQQQQNTSTSSLEDVPKDEPKKKNPYSIEELLKKPEKKKTSFPVSSFVHQPCGLLVDNPCSCNLMNSSL